MTKAEKRKRLNSGWAAAVRCEELKGADPITEKAFREIARLTRGAYCRFDPGAAHQLAELLRAAAAYAAGGMRALADLSARHQAGALKLLEQMRS